MSIALVPPREVLIVEDHADTRESNSILLKLHGCSVHSAPDGQEAQRIAHAHPPDVAFIDLGLPRCNGFECAAQFRADATLGRAVLIALSGFGDDDAIHQAANVGFDYFACKPVEPELLYACTLASRQNELVLCSETLQLKSDRLRKECAELKRRSIAAQKRAREIVTAMLERYHQRL